MRQPFFLPVFRIVFFLFFGPDGILDTLKNTSFGG